MNLPRNFTLIDLFQILFWYNHLKHNLLNPIDQQESKSIVLKFIIWYYQWCQLQILHLCMTFKSAQTFHFLRILLSNKFFIQNSRILHLYFTSFQIQGESINLKFLNKYVQLRDKTWEFLSWFTICLPEQKTTNWMS